MLSRGQAPATWHGRMVPVQRGWGGNARRAGAPKRANLAIDVPGLQSADAPGQAADGARTQAWPAWSSAWTACWRGRSRGGRRRSRVRWGDLCSVVQLISRWPPGPVSADLGLWLSSRSWPGRGASGGHAAGSRSRLGPFQSRSPDWLRLGARPSSPLLTRAHAEMRGLVRYVRPDINVHLAHPPM